MPEKLLEKLISYKMEELNYSYIYLLALNGLFRFDRSRERLKIKAFGKFFCFGSKWSHFFGYGIKSDAIPEFIGVGAKLMP